MSSNPRPLLSAYVCPCGKVPHRHKSQALGHIRSMVRRKLPNSQHLDVYLCGNCGKWHVGHRPGSRDLLYPRRKETDTCA